LHNLSTIFIQNIFEQQLLYNNEGTVARVFFKPYEIRFFEVLISGFSDKLFSCSEHSLICSTNYPQEKRSTKILDWI
jgi:hypothetical protein